MPVDLNNLNLNNLQENLNVITLATCVIGEKTLDVNTDINIKYRLNTERHIFV